MKFNWGHGLLLAIIICTGGILLLVYLSSRHTIDLVTEEYYPKELKYEEQIMKLKNYNSLKEKIRITSGNDSLFIRFPRISEHEDSIKGEIWFYYPADKNGDIKVSIDLNPNFIQSFEMGEFLKGKYEIVIDWSAGENAYLEKELYIFQ